jgi:hypothetical protein
MAFMPTRSPKRGSRCPVAISNSPQHVGEDAQFHQLAFWGAEALIDIGSAHIDGCLYDGDPPRLEKRQADRSAAELTLAGPRSGRPPAPAGPDWAPGGALVPFAPDCVT